MSEIIVKRNIKTLTELQALAFEQKEEGKTDLAEFLLTRTPRAVADILNSAWEIESTQEKLNRAMKSRMDILREARKRECVLGSNGEWLSCTREILHLKSMYESLKRSRGRGTVQTGNKHGNFH